MHAVGVRVEKIRPHRISMHSDAEREGGPRTSRLFVLEYGMVRMYERGVGGEKGRKRRWEEGRGENHEIKMPSSTQKETLQQVEALMESEKQS